MKYLGSLFGIILAISFFGGTRFLRDIRSMIATVNTRSSQLASIAENPSQPDTSRMATNQVSSSYTSQILKPKPKKLSKVLPPPAVKFDASLTYLYFGKGQMREYSGVELVTKPKLRKKLQKSGYFMVKNGTDLSYPALQSTTVITEKPTVDSSQYRNSSGSAPGPNPSRDPTSLKNEDQKQSENMGPKLMDRFERKIYTGQ